MNLLRFLNRKKRVDMRSILFFMMSSHVSYGNRKGALKKPLLNMKKDIIKTRQEGGEVLYLKHLVSLDGS
ncbi:hypothetical protein QUC31_011764 [Theobroma cacao]